MGREGEGHRRGETWGLGGGGGRLQSLIPVYTHLSILSLFDVMGKVSDCCAFSMY